MPYKTDTQRLGDPFLNRRIKLLPCQKEMIHYWRNNMNAGINELARMFHVNKRSIQFILYPERQKRNVELRKQRGGWKEYSDKEYHKEKMKDHRRYKHEVLPT
jgi:hypothetical protein